MKQRLLDVSNHDMNQQSVILNEVIENWKGSLEQVDDISIFGIKI